MALLGGCGALPPGIVQIPTGAATPHSTAPQPRPPILLAYGQFASTTTQTRGSVRLVLNPDGSHAIAIADFSTNSTGALTVVVSDSAAAQTAAPDGNHSVSIGTVSEAAGNQSFALPAGINVDSVKSVSLWNQADAVTDAVAVLVSRG